MTLTDNDTARLAAVMNAVYNPLTGQTTMGRLRTSDPYFEVDQDVEVTYPFAPSSVTRSGDDMIVSLTYRAPVWFRIIPGTGSGGTFQMTTSARVKIR